MHIGTREHVSSDAMVSNTLGAVENETYSREINGKRYEFTETVITSRTGHSVTEYGVWLPGQRDPVHIFR